MKKCILGLAIFLVLITCGCSTPVATNQNLTELSRDKYVAVYEEFHDNGTVVEGNGTIIFLPVPQPTPAPFDYNGKYEYSSQYPVVNSSLKIFYASYKYYLTPGTMYNVVGYGAVYGYPHELNSNLTVEGIDINGTIYAHYQNETVTLKTGDVWKSPVSTRIENQSFQVEDNTSSISSNYRPFVVRYDSYWIVENKGMFDKSSIVK